MCGRWGYKGPEESCWWDVSDGMTGDLSILALGEGSNFGEVPCFNWHRFVLRCMDMWLI